MKTNFDHADSILTVSSQNDEVLAQCTLWRNGALGRFHAGSADAAAMLFDAAEDHLREWGCPRAIGPMDGDTWHHYRLVTKSNGRAPFLLEPQNPTDWPEYFQSSGWTVSARYTSSEIDLSQPANDFSRLAKRLKVEVRELDPKNYLTELRKIYDVSVVSFQKNYLYTPISFENFAAMYSKVEALVVPEFSLIAEDKNGIPVGFVFALPCGRDVIVKTLAVLPESRFAGLGSLLVEMVHQAAREQRYQYAIHALQHQDNRSLKISSRHQAKIFREYTLYEKHL